MEKTVDNYEANVIKPIIRPKCFDDESPVGYLIRLAEINGYKTYKYLVTIEGIITYSRIPSDIEVYNLLKDLSWTGFGEADEVGKVCSYYSGDFYANNIRYCPICLKENNYFRITWQMKIAFVCLKHKVWLNEFCPSCEEPIKYNSCLLGRCRCGSVLADQQVKEIPENMYLLQHYLFGSELTLITPEKQIIETYFELTLAERAEYCLFMLYWLPKVMVERKIDGTYTNFIINQFRQQIVAFAELLVQGISGFWSLIDQLNKLDKHYGAESRLEKLAFTKFYKQFYREFPNKKFLIFRKLIEKYIKKFWKKQLTYRNILFNTDLIRSHPWIPINQAVKEFKLTPSEIQRAIKDKLIIAIEEQKKNRNFILLYKPSIRLNIGEIRDKISFKQAAQILGVTKKQLNQLIIERLFSEISPPKKNYSWQWQFSLQEILEYLKELFELVTDIKGEVVTVAKAMRIIGSRIENPLPKLLKKVKDQEIKITICNDNKNIKAFGISKIELSDWIKTVNYKNNFLTIPQLAIQLKINQQFAYQLVSNELIDCFIDKHSKKD